LTVRWQRRQAEQDSGLKPDRVLKAGEVLLLSELPSQALVVVWSDPE
jgi:hypothetical protein